LDFFGSPVAIESWPGYGNRPRPLVSGRPPCQDPGTHLGNGPAGDRHMDTDRNLLFGVLALQADFLDPDQFAEACSAWAARKGAALADLLVECGWLTAEDRAHVDYLVRRKLKKHDGDARACLTGLATTPELRGALESVADPEVRGAVADLLPALPAPFPARSPRSPAAAGGTP
jgi:hypothetical protein